MSGWPTAPFGDLIVDATGGNQKLLASEFLAEGPYPVVDQGKAFIAGYSDNEADLCRVPSPVIVFGDHTKAWKFVDFPFCLGADGTKILKPSNKLDAKFAYHFLRQVSFPDAGYSRHFKFLKDIQIPLPPLDEQRRIAAVLDQADDLRRKRREALQLCDKLSGRLFDQSFGQRAQAEFGWRMGTFTDVLAAPLRNGVSPSADGGHVQTLLTLSAVTGEGFDPTATKVGAFSKQPPPSHRVSRSDFLMCRGNGNKNLVGRGYFPHEDMPDVVFPDTIIAGRTDDRRVDRHFLQSAWNSPAVRAQIEARAQTTNGTFKVNQTALESIVFPLPPLGAQRDFGQKLMALDRHRKALATQLRALYSVFASLQHRAFNGEL